MQTYQSKSKASIKTESKTF